MDPMRQGSDRIMALKECGVAAVPPVGAMVDWRVPGANRRDGWRLMDKPDQAVDDPCEGPTVLALEFVEGRCGT